MGTDQKHHRLTKTNVLAIRQGYSTGNLAQGDYAVEFGVSRTSISDILRGKTWKHVGGPLTRKGVTTYPTPPAGDMVGVLEEEARNCVRTLNRIDAILGRPGWDREDRNA